MTEGFIASASDKRHRYTKSRTATFGYNGSDMSAMIVAEYTHAISKSLTVVWRRRFSIPHGNSDEE